MSTVEETTGYAPLPDEGEIQKGGKSWHFAYGQIVQGQPAQPKSRVYDNVRKNVYGRLVRVGIHEGTYRDANNAEKRYAQVEADIETAEGLVYVKSSLLDAKGELKPSGATISLAWGLTQFAKGEALRITASESDPFTGSDGMATSITYVNFERIQVKDGKTVAIDVRRPRKGPNEPKRSFIEQWPDLERAIRSHSAFAPRPNQRDDDADPFASGAQATNSTTLDTLCNLLRERGWPTPTQAPNERLALLDAGFAGLGRKSSLSEIDEKIWDQTLNIVIGLSALPDVLKPAAARIASAQSAAAAPAVNTGAFGG